MNRTLQPNDNYESALAHPPGNSNVPPFKKAAAHGKRLKILLHGPSGSGKTTLALQYPRPVVLDLEGGTERYGDSYEFDVLTTTSPDEVMVAIEWLRTSSHPYLTAVIDPITVYWEALQKKYSEIFLRRNKGSKGHRFEFYDLQPRDWMTIKAEYKQLIRYLIDLDMNVVVTAREKPLYADAGFMRVVGETFDCEKSLPYWFDTVVRLYRDDKGRFLGICQKDRSNRLPQGEFEVSYQLFEGLYFKDDLDRVAKPITPATADQLKRINAYINEFKISPEKVAMRLASYEAESLEDLSEEDAESIIQKFKVALAKKGRA